MFSYRKKVLQKKIVAISILIGIITITIFSIVGYIQKQVNAITEEGDPIVVNYTRDIYYGERDNGEPYRTRDFTVSVGNQIVTSFCANPKRRAVKGTFPAVIMQDTDINKRIKLMIYIATANNNITNPIMDSFFSGVNNSDLRYAYSHAVIGALYDNDYHALTTSEEAMIRAIYDPGLGNDRLGDLIDENNDAWLIAKNYRLYTIDRSGTEYAGDRYQDIVWIEPNYQYGNIKVIKRDSNTQSSTPQGSASLQGITFKVYNNGGRFYNSTNNTFYNNGDEIASGTTDANGEITFSNLPLGSYSVKETATNSSYELTSSAAQTTTLSTNGQTQTLTFDNTVKKGSISISKKDKELNSCDQLGKAKFTGIKFQIINNSANPVYYGGNSIAVGSVVTEKTLSATDCSASFEGLPYGQYQVKETGSGVGYLLDTTVHDVTIPSNNSTSLSVEFKNQVIRGDVKFKKVDQNGQVMANIPFRITSKTTGESHIVVTDTNGVVNTSSSINLHPNHTNGYDSISNFDTATYQSYGTWFGKSASNSSAASVNDSLGALPYDTYEIVEVSCKQNQFCYDIESEKQTFDIVSNNVTVDLGNWENDCVDFELSTTATDNADGDKLVTASSGAKIKDAINYCLKADMTFVIKGTLMDKTDNRLLTNSNGQTIEQTVTVTPNTDCGQTEMVFDIDASSLAGHEIVVYERAYQDDILVYAHENMNDASQTVNIVGLATTASDNADGDKYVVASSDSKIKDAINYCLKTGVEFTIKGILMDKATNEALQINGATVEKTIKVTPTTNCGQAEMVFDIDASSLAGHEIVVFETAYQGSTLVVAHNDINDAPQTISIISLATTAVDRSDNDKYIVSSSKSQIKDTINYCLKTGVTFTIKGTLMDKTTGEALINSDDQIIENTITINPTTACGQAEMYFELDTSMLAGHEIVVFEKAYQDNAPIVAHENINDTTQTVSVINFSTFAENGMEIEEEDDEPGEESEGGSDEEEPGSEENGEEEDEGDEEEKELFKKLVEIGDKTNIKDTITYCLKPNTDFTFKGTLIDKKTGEALKVDGEVIEESIDITTEEACGQAEMMFEVDASSLAGHEIVVFERLYYNDEFVMSHEDIDDEEQTVFLIDLTTFATNSEDNTKDVVASGIVRIRDVVKYCLKANTEFTVKGILMNKDTKKPLLVDGKTVEQTITFTPEDTCGETEMFYEFDATSLGGVDVVIFEDVYLGGSLLIRHEDFSNEDETFYILVPVPDTGYVTESLKNSNEQVNNIMVLGIVVSSITVTVCCCVRITARKSFLKRF